MIENHLLYHISTELLWTEASEKIFRAGRSSKLGPGKRTIFQRSFLR
jgi:hypothetical protein